MGLNCPIFYKVELMKYSVIGLFMLALVGCDTSSSHRTQQVAASAIFGDHTSATTRTGTLSGILILGHEVSAITPCGSELDYWVVDKTSSLKHNYEKTIGENPKPYTPVYLSAEVNFLGKASDGFAEEYDGVVEITKIDALSALTLAQKCNSEQTKHLLQNNEVINATYINSKGEKLFVLFYTKENQAVVRFVDNKASATLMSQRPASGMWYKNDEYELSGKGKVIELYKRGELLFKGHQLEINKP